MKTLLTVSALLLCASAGGAQPTRRALLTEAHASTIRDSARVFLVELERVFSSGDREATARMYSADARFRWLESGRVVAKSAQEIAAYLKQIPPGLKVATTYSDLDFVALAPGLAQVVSSFQTTMGDPAAGGASFGGMLTMILVHERDGWRLLHGHASSPVPRGR